MIDAFIFCGPTLPHFKVEEEFHRKIDEKKVMLLDNGKKIQFLPPVAEGDLMKLVPLKPSIIGIIDGYFENVPAVWHKEILFAMSQGIHVLGAASMGALRGAELAPFGMEGIGAIYKAFADGFLEDDDEVTVIHGPDILGFPILSEAMVNIRRTLRDAAEAQTITDSENQLLLKIAKQLHYKERTYRNILSIAAQQGLEKGRIAQLGYWLENFRQDQKMIDALELIANILNKLNYKSEKKQVLYTFESTAIWEKSRSHQGLKNAQELS
jgi:hypothetical protein